MTNHFSPQSTPIALVADAQAARPTSLASGALSCLEVQEGRPNQMPDHVNQRSARSLMHSAYHSDNARDPREQTLNVLINWYFITECSGQ